MTIENGFLNFGFSQNVVTGIVEAAFKDPSPIQKKAIPVVLDRKDVVAQAHTGTGKTAAFALPAIELMIREEISQMLIITPTRELASQVSDEVYKLGKFAGIKTVTVYGGQSYSRQIELIKRGAQVLVATPGRLLDLYKSGKISNFSPSFVVLDEADEMLDMGFLDDISEIFTYIEGPKQTLLFSATMPMPIKKLAETILIEPIYIKIESRDTTNQDIKQQYYIVEEKERDDATIRLMDSETPEKSIIFCRTKKEADRLSTALIARGHLAKALHGDMEQPQREEAMRSFRDSKFDILVATDVAARGLDVQDVTHVFNYHIPFDPESYVHRIGRTGRAGKKGTAITLVTPLEFKELQRIKKIVGTSMEHKYIPSRQDVKDAWTLKMIEDIKNEEIKEDAMKLVGILEEGIELSQVAYKLLSILLKNKDFAGPEQIGISGQRVEKIMSQTDSSRGSYRRGGGNRGGGSYRGSRSGGYNRDRSGGESSGDRRPPRDRDGGYNRDRSGESSGDRRPPRDRDGGYNRDRGNESSGNRRPPRDRDGGYNRDRNRDDREKKDKWKD